MSGTVKGGKLAAQANKERYGKDYYHKIGKMGGSAPSDKPKGFAYAAANGLDLHIKAGQKGGRISRIRKEK